MHPSLALLFLLCLFGSEATPNQGEGSIGGYNDKSFSWNKAEAFSNYPAGLNSDHKDYSVKIIDRNRNAYYRSDSDLNAASVKKNNYYHYNSGGGLITGKNYKTLNWNNAEGSSNYAADSNSNRKEYLGQIYDGNRNDHFRSESDSKLASVNKNDYYNYNSGSYNGHNHPHGRHHPHLLKPHSPVYSPPLRYPYYPQQIHPQPIYPQPIVPLNQPFVTPRKPVKNYAINEGYYARDIHYPGGRPLPITSYVPPSTRPGYPISQPSVLLPVSPPVLYAKPVVNQPYLGPSVGPVGYPPNNLQVSPIGSEDDKPKQLYKDSFGNSPNNPQQGFPKEQRGLPSYPQYSYPDSNYAYSYAGSFGSSYANQQNSYSKNWDYNNSGSNLPDQTPSYHTNPK